MTQIRHTCLRKQFCSYLPVSITELCLISSTTDLSTDICFQISPVSKLPSPGSSIHFQHTCKHWLQNTATLPQSQPTWPCSTCWNGCSNWYHLSASLPQRRVERALDSIPIHSAPSNCNGPSSGKTALEIWEAMKRHSSCY